ncbi:hypothetical protein P175DRAFT_0559956 [Aspergillus ochraceoroseus IBT 24754]|uniref:Uncharacterized protein n=1 Tax=Aspergillus ochraceoroseus IBT 24754 TaxID=1392256 RepID=A0A2T5LP56_9EURO|nr:uncharacterized protein P175DRAFT_0559956 [Aspergillus ochraceoroseus IBT 24754]PTU18058.1 hypothetical protein P175DRAFT_0559956 [Aspergillus ochraceoroseus IBT 24754]
MERNRSHDVLATGGKGIMVLRLITCINYLYFIPSAQTYQDHQSPPLPPPIHGGLHINYESPTFLLMSQLHRQKMHTTQALPRPDPSVINSSFTYSPTSPWFNAGILDNAPQLWPSRGTASIRFWTNVERT